MEAYIALLLLVVPGFIVTKVCNRIGTGSKATEKFDVILNSLSYNVFVVLVSYSYLVHFCGIDANVIKIKELFMSAGFIVDYIWITLFSMVTVIVGWSFCFKKLYEYITNQVRSKTNQDLFCEAGVLQKTFSDGQPHYIKIEQDGKEIVKGCIQFLCEENKSDIFVDNVELIKELHEVRPEFLKKIKGVYYDFNTKTKITEYEYDVVT